MTQTIDREREALKAILDALLPQLMFYAVWTHRVVSAEGTGPVTITCVPDDKRLPNESKIVLRPGADGGYSTPAPGSEIAVGFLNGDPERPYVHSLDPTAPSGSSWVPSTTLVSLGPSPAALAHSLEVLAVHSAITTFTLAVQTVLAQMVLGYSSLTGGQITAWNNAVTAIGNAISAQALTLPTTVVKGT